LQLVFFSMGILNYVLGSWNIQFLQEWDKEFNHRIAKTIKQIIVHASGMRKECEPHGPICTHQDVI